MRPSPPKPGEVVGASLPKLASGRGAWVYDVDGAEYLDGSGGPAVFCLGHAHPEVNEAIRRQLEVLPRPARQGIPVLLTGDFNSPSFLDWTAAVAAVRCTGLIGSSVRRSRGVCGTSGRPARTSSSRSPIAA